MEDDVSVSLLGLGDSIGEAVKYGMQNKEIKHSLQQKYKNEMFFFFFSEYKQKQ